MTKTERIISLAIFLTFSSMVGFAIEKVESLSKRILALEKRCLAQCKYGDSDCVRACAKAGHCPFQEMP
jgi:hypothetical protein